MTTVIQLTPQLQIRTIPGAAPAMFVGGLKQDGFINMKHSNYFIKLLDYVAADKEYADVHTVNDYLEENYHARFTLDEKFELVFDSEEYRTLFLLRWA